jgi:sugar O-acyltransferase (sialic acid O-acetyltransferase NeuD family)
MIKKPKTPVKPLVIVGTGNGGRIALDIALSLHLPILGFISDTMRVGESINGSTVLGGDLLLDDLEFVRNSAFVVPIGPNSPRRRLALRLIESGAEMPPLVHPSCIVSAHASIGAASVLVPGVIVNCNARIGRFCVVNAGATIEHDSVLGDGTLISPGVHFGGATVCGEGSFVGIGACTVAGIRIGREAVVGAGAVVIRDVPDEDVVAGNPARSIKKAKLSSLT